MSRARALGRFAARGLGGSVVGVGVGAVGYGVHNMASKITAPNGDMSKYPTRFWIPGLAMGFAGHFMRRKPKLALMGAALCGAAGFSIAEGANLAYTIKQNQKAQGQPASPGVQGLDETGAVMGARSFETGALLPASEVQGIYDENLVGSDAMAL